ncbi:MAG: L,D-transpeptidase [Pararhizobium sp.]
MRRKNGAEAAVAEYGGRGITRRNLLAAGGMAAIAAGLAGCAGVSSGQFREETSPFSNSPFWGGGGPVLPPGAVSYAEVYDSEVDGGYVIPAVPYRQIDPIYYRQVVENTTGEEPGTIVVDTHQKFLYLTRDDGSAIRYGVGVGREGFAWSGRGQIQWKQKWPTWTPPSDMIDRQPELKKYANGGMDPGLMNPLGARAMYIFHDGKDTLYRLHGSPEWWSIGKAMSSGCIRLINQDVIDLYSRVPVHTKVLVI